MKSIVFHLLGLHYQVLLFQRKVCLLNDESFCSVKSINIALAKKFGKTFFDMEATYVKATC